MSCRAAICTASISAVFQVEENGIRYQALPGNAYPEALPPIFMETLRGRSEAEPLDTGSQAQPGS